VASRRKGEYKIKTTFPPRQSLFAWLARWKHFTARGINRAIGQRGNFWQQDGFDHLVRSLEHFEAFRRYIAANGSKAGLRSDEFCHYAKDLAK
jgi:hypothetical protein